MVANLAPFPQGISHPYSEYKPLTYATLPKMNVGFQGFLAVISDCATATPGATASGGGSNKVFVWYNGTAWIVLGGAAGDNPSVVSYLQLEALTYTTLPASPAAGMFAYITDATTSQLGATASAGSGSNKVLLWYNGSAWIIVGYSDAIQGQAGGVAAPAGAIGQTVGGSVLGSVATATVTITIAAPGVVTWTGHEFSTTVPQPVVFTTSGALPTGLTAGAVYWTIPSSVTTNTFEVATSVANAIAGTAITTTGTQSGTQTGTAGTAMANNTAINVTGLALPAGDWDVWGEVVFNAASATVTNLQASINTTSATLAAAGTVVGGSYASFAGPTMTTVNAVPTINVPQCQLNEASTTNVFLVVEGTFSAGTLVGYGFLFARRRD